MTVGCRLARHCFSSASAILCMKYVLTSICQINQWMNNWMDEWTGWPRATVVEKNLDWGMKNSTKFLPSTWEPPILPKPLNFSEPVSSAIKWGQQHLYSVPHWVVSKEWMWRLPVKCKALPTVSCFCCDQRRLASPAGMERTCTVCLPLCFGFSIKRPLSVSWTLLDAQNS